MDAIILIGHGSTVAGASRDMQRVVAALTRRDRPVQFCFVDQAAERLPALVAELATTGVTHVVVLPWLLQLGKHLREDIPRAIAATFLSTPEVAVALADPLGFDETLVQLAERRVAEAQLSVAKLSAAQVFATKVSAAQHESAQLGSGTATTPGSVTVHLVGAGPGDPGMVTVRARELIATCDCLIYDRLVAPELLALVPAKAERHEVGKTGWGPGRGQADINQLIVACGRRFRRVVRLKGGDPLVFGRGGEELAALAEAGLPAEVVPGVTSALGAAAALQLPLTLRRSASTLAFATGHGCVDGHVPDFKALAGIDTLALYMGLRQLPELCASLIAHGRPATTPACAIEWATRPNQRVVECTLADLAQRVQEAGLASPTLVVGEVVRERIRVAAVRAAVDSEATQET